MSLRQFLFDPFQLGLELLVDCAEAGFDAAATAGDLRVGDNPRGADALQAGGDLADLVAQRLHVVGVQVNRDLAAAGGHFERLLDQRERDLRFLGDFAANDARGNRRGDANGTLLPVCEPGLLRLGDFGGRLPQRGQQPFKPTLMGSTGAKLPFDGSDMTTSREVAQSPRTTASLLEACF